MTVVQFRPLINSLEGILSEMFVNLDFSLTLGLLFVDVIETKEIET